MKKLLQILFVFLLIASSAMAQKRVVSGTVASKEDGLLQGLSVKASDASAVTQSLLMQMLVECTSFSKTIEFSCIGY
jgi:hypothetical protein